MGEWDVSYEEPDVDAWKVSTEPGGEGQAAGSSGTALPPMRTTVGGDSDTADSRDSRVAPAQSVPRRSWGDFLGEDLPRDVGELWPKLEAQGQLAADWFNGSPGGATQAALVRQYLEGPGLLAPEEC